MKINILKAIYFKSPQTTFFSHAYLAFGKAMFLLLFVCWSVCLQMGPHVLQVSHVSHGDPPDLFKLVPLGYLDLVKLAHLGSLRPPPPAPFPHPYIYWEVGGWISTETPSCYRCFCYHYQGNDISILHDLKLENFFCQFQDSVSVNFGLFR